MDLKVFVHKVHVIVSHDMERQSAMLRNPERNHFLPFLILGRHAAFTVAP